MDCVPTLRGEIKKARASNYDIYSVINEFVDNSLDAHADKVVIDIREYVEDEQSWVNKILISDNAPLGIVDVRSIFSWTFERKRNQKEIGEFGTGLKSASVNIADKLTILTIKNGKDYLQAVADWHEMSAENTWTPKVLKINKEFLRNYHPFSTGTTIMLENIRHDFLQQQTDLLETLYHQLSWSYKYFLRENPHVSLIVRSSSCSYELSHQIPSPQMIYFFDKAPLILESKVHVIKQCRSFQVFVQRNCPYWEQIEVIETRKNGNHVLKALEVGRSDKVFTTLLFRSCTYYEPDSTLPMSFGNVDVVRNHRILVKNTTYRMPRSDAPVAYIKHELFYDNKTLNNILGVQFNKINNGYITNGSMKHSLEYLQKCHEKELMRFEKTQLHRVIVKEKDEEDFLCLEEEQEKVVVSKTTTLEQQSVSFETRCEIILEDTTDDMKPSVIVESPTPQPFLLMEETRRKNFSMETKLEVIKQQECRDCEFDFRLSDDILPIDYDHINGKPFNNSIENCQALSVISHALKTRRPSVFDKHRKNPLPYIVDLLNHITSSKYFIDAYVKKQIQINKETEFMIRHGFFSFTEDNIFMTSS